MELTTSWGLTRMLELGRAMGPAAGAGLVRGPGPARVMRLARARPGGRAMRLPRATWALVAASVAGGGATLAIALWRHAAVARVHESQWIVAAAIGLLALGSWVWPVVVYRGGESEALSMDEAFFVILALLVPPLVTLGTLGLATVLAQAGRRRSAVKSAFNVGQVLIAAGVALALSRTIAVPSGTLGAAQAGAVALGATAYFVINTFLVASVMVTMGTSWRRSSWYLRLPGSSGAPWSGVVRLECSADLPVPEVIRLADLSAVLLPPLASSPHKDPRAPQNLVPIGGLERELRRRLGDQQLLYRSLRAAANRPG